MDTQRIEIYGLPQNATVLNILNFRFQGNLKLSLIRRQGSSKYQRTLKSLESSEFINFQTNKSCNYVT